MKSKLITIGVVILMVGGMTLFNIYTQPAKETPEQAEASKQAEEKIAQAEAATAEDTPEDSAEENKAESKPEAEAAKTEVTEAEVETKPGEAPDVFVVKFECSNGDFLMEVHKDWAPIGAQRIYDLVQDKFFDECRFFRVVPGFVVQFGLPGDPALCKKWCDNNIKDEPVKQSNTPGMVTFAKTQMPNTRSTQLFINTGNNGRLDGMGFSPFGKVIKGIDVVKSINAEYGEAPNQLQIEAQGNDYLKRSFPNLDYVKKARILQ